jgi:hypothetical protein
MNGQEKYCIFKNIKIQAMFPDLKKARKFDRLFKDLLEIVYFILKSKSCEDDLIRPNQILNNEFVFQDVIMTDKEKKEEEKEEINHLKRERKEREEDEAEIIKRAPELKLKVEKIKLDLNELEKQNQLIESLNEKKTLFYSIQSKKEEQGLLETQLKISLGKNDRVFMIKNKTKRWLMLFNSLFHENEVTPYIHKFCAHVNELEALHGPINSFNQEGHEKFNDIIKNDYYRSTYRHAQNNEYLEQLLDKKQRQEYKYLNLILKK